MLSQVSPCPPPLLACLSFSPPVLNLAHATPLKLVTILLRDLPGIQPNAGNLSKKKHLTRPGVQTQDRLLLGEGEVQELSEEHGPLSVEGTVAAEHGRVLVGSRVRVVRQARNLAADAAGVVLVVLDFANFVFADASIAWVSRPYCSIAAVATGR